MRHGSLMDPAVTLYGADFREVASCDDTPEGPDPRLEYTPAASGALYLVVRDAHATGGPLHNYRLTVRVRE
jgi:hypothetical protein